jgi:hypothetical protein
VNFTLVIDPLAEADLALARAEYDAIDPDLGARFATAVEDAFERIRAIPALYPPGHGRHPVHHPAPLSVRCLLPGRE